MNGIMDRWQITSEIREFLYQPNQHVGMLMPAITQETHLPIESNENSPAAIIMTSQFITHSNEIIFRHRIE